MPGERELLEEFVGRLRPTLLGQLVRVVFDKMTLAGETGCLLRIDHELRDAVTAARRQWAEGPPKEQLLLFPETRRSATAQLRLFDVSGITDASFWLEAEARVLEALRGYAQEAANGRAYRRRLFADDVVQGFAFIHLCQRRFDVVLMNPPFGEFTKTFKEEARRKFPNSYNDIFGAFTEVAFEMLAERGVVGAITSRTGFFLSSFGNWRRQFLLRHHNVRLLVDLGEQVMDDAMVEAAAYCLSKGDRPNSFPVVRLVSVRVDDRVEPLASAVTAIRSSTVHEALFWCNDDAFAALPDSPFVYWVESKSLRQLASMPSFEHAIAQVRQGLVTSDNPRFVRAMWEVPSATLGTRCNFTGPTGATWVPLVMSGPSQPWYSPLTVVLKWKDNGAELREFVRKWGPVSRRIASEEFYFRTGISWTRRAVRFIPYAIPRGCIPTASRYMAFPTPGAEFAVLGATASEIASAFLRFYGEKFAWPNFLVETVKALPWPSMPQSLIERLREVAEREVARRRRAYQNKEPFHDFTAPGVCFPNPDARALDMNLASFLGEELEAEIARAYGFTALETIGVVRDLREAIEARGSASKEPNEAGDEDDNDADAESPGVGGPEDDAEALLSYSVGVVVGRWDVRIAKEPRLAPELPGPFDPLPVCPPAMLVGPDGLPASPGRIVSEEWLRQRRSAASIPGAGDVSRPLTPDDEYPIRVDWDGILVDDPGHPDDIVGRVTEVIEYLLDVQAAEFEKRACALLGAAGLRSYLRNAKGFFEAHIRRYTKSRRRAPIYWLLQSARKNYGIWIYYHRLDRDTVFKCLRNYVEPKIRGETVRLREMKAEIDSTKDSIGRKELSKLEKTVERQEGLIEELNAFKEKLEQIGELGIDPDVNDGVILNIAPFQELTPWKEAKTSWTDLVEGKFEWSFVGKRLREKGLVGPGRKVARHG